MRLFLLLFVPPSLAAGCSGTDGGLSGHCVPRAHAANAANAYCADLPGTKRTEATPYVGTSDAPPLTVEVCLP